MLYVALIVAIAAVALTVHYRREAEYYSAKVEHAVKEAKRHEAMALALAERCAKVEYALEILANERTEGPNVVRKQ